MNLVSFALVSMLAKIRFEEVSNTLLNKVLSGGRGSSRIDVVFDIYQGKSIKTAKPAERGSKLGIVFSQIKPRHRIKNWKRILDKADQIHGRKLERTTSEGETG